MKIRILFILMTMLSFPVWAQQTGCATNALGEVVCAGQGGGADVNQTGQVVTGPGECAPDANGYVVCSKVPGGGALANGHGRVITGKGDCAENSHHLVVCAPTVGGGAAVDGQGEVRTGPGRCIVDGTGTVMCATIPAGGASLDATGLAVCAGGCVLGR